MGLHKRQFHYEAGVSKSQQLREVTAESRSCVAQILPCTGHAHLVCVPAGAPSEVAAFNWRALGFRRTKAASSTLESEPFLPSFVPLAQAPALQIRSRAVMMQDLESGHPPS